MTCKQLIDELSVVLLVLCIVISDYHITDY